MHKIITDFKNVINITYFQIFSKQIDLNRLNFVLKINS